MDSVILGQRIRQAREALGISQEELAVLVSKTQKAISQYEIGTRRMYVTDIEKMSNALHIPITYLIYGQPTLDEVDELILAEIQRLSSAESKRALLQIVRSFTDFAKKFND